MVEQYAVSAPLHLPLLPVGSRAWTLLPGTLAQTVAQGRTPRGPAAPDKQLGAVQLAVLHWLRQEETTIKGQGTIAKRLLAGEIKRWPRSAGKLNVPPEKLAQRLAIYERYGVPWQKVAAHIGHTPSQVSAAVRTLRRRELIHARVVNGRVTHARITHTGIRAVTFYRLGSEEAARDDYYKTLAREWGPQGDWTVEQRSQAAEGWRATRAALMRHAEEGIATYEPSAKQH